MRPIPLFTIVFAALALGLLMLSGCTTAASRINTSAGDDALCKSWGTTPGSESYVSCRMQQQNAALAGRAIAVQESYAIRQATSDFADNFARAVTGTSPSY